MKALGVSERDGFRASSASRSTTRCRSAPPSMSSCPLAVDQGLGILVWSPLAGGLLSGKYRRNQEPPEGSRHLTDWNEPRRLVLSSRSVGQGTVGTCRTAGHLRSWAPDERTETLVDGQRQQLVLGRALL